VVATHGGGARQGVARLLDWPHEAARTLAGLDNCHWSELRYGARSGRAWQLWSYNAGVTPAAEQGAGRGAAPPPRA
jgi:probable phosphoglycerate mutase